MRYWVYIHTCPNDKKYVGCTKQARPELRWKEGKGYLFNVHFSQAIQKYGWDNIKHEAWELTSESEMYYAEKYLIAYYHTTKSRFGYNHRTGGMEGSKKTEPRKPVSLETREKLRNASFHKDPEYRKKLSEVSIKRCSDPEYRKRLSEALKGVPKPKLKGVPKSEETRKKLSEAWEERRKRGVSEETRKKLSEAKKGQGLGIPKSEECKQHMRESSYMKSRPRFKVTFQDGTERIMTKPNIYRNYINKGIEVKLEQVCI